MKKAACLVLSLALIVCTLAGCGGKSGGTSASAQGGSSTAGGGSSANTGGSGSANTDGLDFGEYTPDNPLVLKSTSHAPGGDKNAFNLANKMLAAKIGEATNGAVEVQVFNDGILTTSDAQTMESIIAGTVDMGLNNTAIYSNYVKEYSVLDLCYLFDDDDHVKEFMQSDLATEIKGLMQESGSGAVMLSLNYTGWKQMGSTRPVQSIEDMKGLIIRTNDGEIYQKSFTAFGAAPVFMATGEVMAGLSQGVLEAMEHSYNVFDSNGYWEYLNKITETNHICQLYGASINEKVWNSMTPDLQQVFLDCAAETSMEMFDIAREMQTQSKQNLLDNGCEIYEIDTKPFFDAVQPVNDEYTAQNGSYWYDGIRALVS